MIKKKIAIIGLGYVGLPLAVAFSKKFRVIGYDINQRRIQELKNGHDHTLEIEDHLLSSVSNNLSYSFNIEDIKDCNIYIITVPTPVTNFNKPDLNPLLNATKTVAEILKKNDITL